MGENYNGPTLPHPWPAAVENAHQVSHLSCAFHPAAPGPSGASNRRMPMDLDLHSLPRHLIELRMEHADLDALIDRASVDGGGDDLVLRRLKKRRLSLRDRIARLEVELEPPQPA